MRAPSSLAFLLAVSVANALVIPVPALNSLNLDLAAPVNNVIDAVPVVYDDIPIKFSSSFRFLTFP